MQVPKEGPGPLGSTGFGEVPGQHYIPGGSGELETPAPGIGGSYQGPGGMAPPFAPGGPENPYPPSAGMPPNPNLPPGSAAFQPGFIGSGAPGSIPEPFQQTQGPGMQPGHYPLPQKQQSGEKMSSPQMQYGPQPGSQQSGVKPRGIKTVPPPEGKHPPKEPPEPPGQWVTVDAGKGQPPAYGFIQQKDEASTDTGLGDEDSKKKEQQGKHEQKGHYVSVHTGAPKKDDDEPTWCWIPEIGADYGMKHKEESGSLKPPPLK